jgi:p-hydroxybenzoate 3-monooxygenase
VLSTYAFDHGIGWLTVLAEAPPPRYPLFGVSDRGFAAQFFRGPQASRYYLQCTVGETPADWPAERIWPELRARLGDDELVGGPISEVGRVEMRSSVCEPMHYGRLYLVGDAAHIITPLGGKGMNLAVYDAEVLALALRSAVLDGDPGGLRRYSPDCLARTWSYQEFSRWMLEMLHDGGDDSAAGAFRRRLARARLDRLFTDSTAARSFGEMLAGIA